MKSLVATLTLLFLIAAPRLAEACSVCGAADDKTKDTFIFTTALLTFLPLTIGGAILFWAIRKGRQMDREIDRDRG